MIRTIIISFIFLLISTNIVLAKNIEIKGNKRIEDETIKSYFMEGNEYNPAYINAVIKELYKTEFFQEISISNTIDKLIINIKERPIIDEIIFKGNKAIKDDIIENEISLKVRGIYNKSSLINDINKISAIYKRNGYIDISIKPKIYQLNNNRIKLYFVIYENKKSKIKKIIFSGNKQINTKDLKSIISSKEKKWYRGSATYYDPDRVNLDKEIIRNHYLNQGYANFELLNSKIEYIEQIRAFIVNHKLSEGGIYYVNNIKISDLFKNIEIKNVTNLITIKNGDRFSLEAIEKNIDKIIKYLNNKGYAFVDIDYDIIKNIENKTLDIHFKINNSDRIYIRKINIIGNNRTEDNVIRRELKIIEGDSYSNYKIMRSRQKIINLGFFKKVEIKKHPIANSNQIDIDIILAEDSTGELNIGIGYSTTEKMLGNISVKEKNLMGKAHNIALSYQKSSLSDDIEVSYLIPNISNRDFAYGIDVFNIDTEYEESSTNIESSGFNHKIYYEISDFLHQSISYSYKIDDIDSESNTSSLYIEEQLGKTTYSAIKQTLTYDKRDNKINPTNGYSIKLSSDLAGIGGDIKIYKIDLGFINYYPMIKNKLIFRFLVKSGMVQGYNSKDVRINHRFFVGGSTLKGFDSSGIGPRDQNGNALGGKYYARSTLELAFPLGLPEELGFKGLLYTESGMLTGLDNKAIDINDDSSIRSSVGIGLSWDSPLGPIRFDYAKAIKKKSYDKIEKFRINFGSRF